MKRWLRWSIIFLLGLSGLYLLGPHPKTPVYAMDWPEVPGSCSELEKWIAGREATHPVKPDNQARIVWGRDSLKEPTEYSLVYLHGFSASQEEGNPVHRFLARRFGCNLYLSRLAEHGLDSPEAMLRLTPEGLWASAKEALAIGSRLGKKVILVGTSTGGTLALQLAAAFPQKVAGIVLLSPNITINDPNAWLLSKPWGLQMARMIKKSPYITSPDQRPPTRQYWYGQYRLEGAVALQELLETTMDKAHFQKIHQPVDLLYYYRDPTHQDNVVRVSSMLEMFDQLGTADSQKRKQALPEAGDHVVGCWIKSHDVPGVERQVDGFLREVMGLPVVDSTLREGIAALR